MNDPLKRVRSRRARSAISHIGIRSGFYTIPLPTSTPVGRGGWEARNGLCRVSVASTVDGSDAQKVLGFEARAPDQGAIDVGDRHQFLGVRRLHRPPVQNAHRVSDSPVTLDDA